MTIILIISHTNIATGAILASSNDQNNNMHFEGSPRDFGRTRERYKFYNWNTIAKQKIIELQGKTKYIREQWKKAQFLVRIQILQWLNVLWTKNVHKIA